jgi:hypothetical protein
MRKRNDFTIAHLPDLERNADLSYSIDLLLFAGGFLSSFVAFSQKAESQLPIEGLDIKNG